MDCRIQSKTENTIEYRTVQNKNAQKVLLQTNYVHLKVKKTSNSYSISAKFFAQLVTFKHGFGSALI